MMSILRSQKANNYQVVIGLFLLASGASKREMDVLAHAGISISYTSIMMHLKALSKEGILAYQKIIKEVMCSIVWDNLNIAFRVESQRLNSSNHFDNGTTATLIPLWNPFTNGSTPHGTLPLSMKPPRESTKLILDYDFSNILPSPECARQLTSCCLWRLKYMAVEYIEGLSHLKKAIGECPTVDQILVHKTEQYPLPAMHEDESSIDGTIRVYETILKNVGLTDETLTAHGLLFNDGDLLTDSLFDKVREFK